MKKSKLGKNTILNLLTKASEAVLYFATDIMAANLLDEKTYGVKVEEPEYVEIAIL